MTTNRGGAASFNPRNGIVTTIRACGVASGQVAKGMTKISYSGTASLPKSSSRRSGSIIRFTLSFRDVEDLLAERGIIVSYETIRRWVNHFGPRIAADLRRRRPKPHMTWHLDEVYLRIAGRMVYLWRAVDAEGEVLDVLVQSRRNKTAALKLMRKLLRKYAFVPDRLVTDDSDHIAPPPMISASRGAMTAVDGATTEPRIRISRPDDGNTRCKGSRAPDRRKDFSRRMRQSTTPSTSNATSPQQERTEPSGPRRCRRGAKPSLRLDFSDAKFPASNIL